MRIFVAGGTGQVGSRLVPQLIQRGDEVLVLTRNRGKAVDKFGAAARYLATLAPGEVDQRRGSIEIVEGDPMQPGEWMERVGGCTGVVNLVGEGVFARRWSDEFKALLRDSRVKSTQNIVAAIERAGSARPATLVNGSAVGYYGFHEDEVITEENPPGDDFLAKLCIEWEAAARHVEDFAVRLVLLRTGVVFDKRGGALRQMMLPFMMFVGGKAGSGNQWVPWIHHQDEVGLILLALDNQNARGPLNAAAPMPVTNRDLAKALGAALGRPSFFPTPEFMLRLFLGEVSQIVTQGQRAIPKRAEELGYHFKFPEINAALKEIVAE